MPIAPRSNKKAQKIAFAIIGTPANLQKGTRRSKPMKSYNPNELYLGPQDKNEFIT